MADLFKYEYEAVLQHDLTGRKRKVRVFASSEIAAKALAREKTKSIHFDLLSIIRVIDLPHNQEKGG